MMQPNVVFLRDVSKEFLILYVNDNLALGSDFNCTISTLDKKGVRPIDGKKASLNELQSLIKTHNLLVCTFRRYDYKMVKGKTVKMFD